MSMGFGSGTNNIVELILLEKGVKVFQVFGDSMIVLN
jgi:hypothetical protein